MLGMAVAAPALVAIGTTAALSATPAPDLTEWNRLVDQLDRAVALRAAAAIADDKAQAAYKVASQSIGPKPTAPTFTTQYPRPIDEMTISEIKRLPVIKAPASAEYEAALAAWTANDDEISRRTNADHAEAAWEQSVSDHFAAANALLAYPAPNCNALLYKLALIEVEWRGCDLCQNVQRHIFADVRRFVGKEG